ncbi:MAG: hypothetical protein NT090_03980, partial [Acidobacteria bacterium]|nr:hypothetical protein [Acidobacteriota bacterium]
DRELLPPGRLCFTLHLISTIRHEWRQPLAVTELPFQALHLSWWIFTRMFVSALVLVTVKKPADTMVST